MASDFSKSMSAMRVNSALQQLAVDPEAARNMPNQSMREVKSGHYVPVTPQALPDPQLVLYSPDMAAELGLTEAQCLSTDFAQFFSGDIRLTDTVCGAGGSLTFLPAAWSMALHRGPHHMRCLFTVSSTHVRSMHSTSHRLQLPRIPLFLNMLLTLTLTLNVN